MKIDLRFIIKVKASKEIEKIIEEIAKQINKELKDGR